MEQSPSWEANRFQLVKKFPTFLEPDGSLLHLQVPGWQILMTKYSKNFVRTQINVVFGCFN